MAADGSHEVDDPLRPRWRRTLGILLIAQLLLVPVLGFVLVRQEEKLDSRVGVVRAGNANAPEAMLVYAPCPGERIRHIVLSEKGAKGTLNTVLWSAVGDAPADQPIRFGADVPRMTTRQRLAKPVGPKDNLILLVATNQVTNPQQLSFSLADVPATGVLTFGGTVRDQDAFRTAALDNTRCGAQDDDQRGLLTTALFVELALAVVGVGLLTLPRYPAPRSRYA